MNRHWEKLEYPEILRRLARHTDFSGGEALALALEPTFYLRDAQELLALTSEARLLLEAHPDFALGGVRDIRPLAARAQRGITLQPTELLEVRSTLIGAERVRRVVGRLEAQFPMLADLRRASIPCRGWRKQSPECWMTAARSVTVPRTSCRAFVVSCASPRTASRTGCAG